MNNEKTILVIEDEKGIRNFIHNALTTNGYKTILAENGKNARTAFLSQCPDLVLLDLGLPDADGLTLLQRLYSSSLPGTKNPKKYPHWIWALMTISPNPLGSLS